MSTIATASERGQRRHWAPRAATTEPAVRDSRPPIPAGSDAEAFVGHLYAHYWSDLVSHVNGMLSDRHQAEEIVQETMLRAWRHAGNLTPERGSVCGWLCRVAYNIMVDRIRYRRARPTEVEDTAAAEVGVMADHGPEVVDSVYVLRALAQLRPAHRAVPYLVYYQGRTCAEAAVALGVPVGTAKSRLHYALRQLRTLLAEDGAGPEAA